MHLHTRPMFFYSFDALSSEERDQHVKKKRGGILSSVYSLPIFTATKYFSGQLPI